MATKTQLRVLAHLLDNTDRLEGIRELARETRTAYCLANRTVHRLESQGAVELRKAGSTKVITLSPQADPAMLAEAERHKREGFYSSHPGLRPVLQKIIAGQQSIFFVLLVFGSYAKGSQRKDSDLDLLAIVPDESGARQMEAAIRSAARTSPHTLHETVVTEAGHRKMLGERGMNVALEAKRRHIVIYGDEQYHRMA